MVLIAECVGCKTRLSGPAYDRLTDLFTAMERDGWLVDDIDPRCPKCLQLEGRHSEHAELDGESRAF
ncbi:hypothetical protein [Amycolatopsis alkalitolerans]|uniref:Uncharacterized protein n=1 Tax=Amycolatopsis alkalitolerans TaxID=2547244 RepID=A0A5C4LT93_9PSEU|nr:hypothetical protein [Amycolatopsis alkalitolerans]TNC22237.1 hypothetical protein FG385_26040 [Amycolatopsis alkalitolerans]